MEACRVEALKDCCAAEALEVNSLIIIIINYHSYYHDYYAMICYAMLYSTLLYSNSNSNSRGLGGLPGHGLRVGRLEGEQGGAPPEREGGGS